MMKIRKLALLGATALMVSGPVAVMAQTTSPESPPAVSPHKSPAAKTKQHASGTTTQTQQPLTGTNYVTYARTADLFEIEASKIAVQKAQNKEVRDFAQRVLNENTNSSVRLDSAARQAGVTPTTPVLTTRQKAKLDELQQASISSFDKLYILSQIETQERELRLHNSYYRNGDVVVLKSTSTELIPAVRHNVAEAKRISGVLANERGGAS